MEVAAEAETHALSPLLHGAATLTLGAPLFPAFLVSGCMLRRSFRKSKHIQGGLIDDFCCGGCCHWCNLCQMARETIATKVYLAHALTKVHELTLVDMCVRRKVAYNVWSARV